jgi:hypothetical protein
MFWGTLILIIVLASLWTVLATIAVGLGYLNETRLRHVVMALFILSFIPAFMLWSEDPNDGERARAWHGRYAIRGCTVGIPVDGPWEGPVINFGEERVFTIQDGPNDTLPVVGEWNYVSTEYGDWIDLAFEDDVPIQIMGNRDYFRADSPLPVASCR